MNDKAIHVEGEVEGETPGEVEEELHETLKGKKIKNQLDMLLQNIRWDMIIKI